MLSLKIMLLAVLCGRKTKLFHFLTTRASFSPSHFSKKSKLPVSRKIKSGLARRRNPALSLPPKAPQDGSTEGSVANLCLQVLLHLSSHPPPPPSTSPTCIEGPAAATFAGIAAGFALMSCRLKLKPCNRLLAEGAPEGKPKKKR